DEYLRRHRVRLGTGPVVARGGQVARVVTPAPLFRGDVSRHGHGMVGAYSAVAAPVAVTLQNHDALPSRQSRPRHAPSPRSGNQPPDLSPYSAHRFSQTPRVTMQSSVRNPSRVRESIRARTNLSPSGFCV